MDFFPHIWQSLALNVFSTWKITRKSLPLWYLWKELQDKCYMIKHFKIKSLDCFFVPSWRFQHFKQLLQNPKHELIASFFINHYWTHACLSPWALSNSFKCYWWVKEKLFLGKMPNKIMIPIIIINLWCFRWDLC